MSNLPKTFSTYLKLQGASSVTCRNYLVDINHFLGWLELKIRGLNLPLFEDETKLISLYFTEEFISEYKRFLLSNSLPFSTINRRLSALRTFGRFCLSQAWIKENPAKKVTNVTLAQSTKRPARGGVNAAQSEEILEEFRRHLEAEKTSSNTIKSYLSDIKEFFTWAEILGT